MSISQSLSIRGKLLLMILPPILGYAFFNIHDTWAIYERLRGLGLVERGLDLSQGPWRDLIFNIAISFMVWMLTFLVVYRMSLWISRPAKAPGRGPARARPSPGPATARRWPRCRGC